MHFLIAGIFYGSKFTNKLGVIKGIVKIDEINLMILFPQVRE